MRIQPMKAGLCSVLTRTGMLVRCWSVMKRENPCKPATVHCSGRMFPLVKRSKVGRFYFPVSVS